MQNTEIVIYIILLTITISFTGFQNEKLKSYFLFNPYRIFHNNEKHRIITHLFIHADWSHLMFNMFSFYFLGTYLLRSWVIQIGKIDSMVHFSLLYLLGGIFASFLLLVKHKKNPHYNSLGASGAVSAVVFATILWNPNLELILFLIPIPIKAYIFGPIYLLIEFYAMKRGNSNIAHEAHISGAIFGLLYVTLLNPKKLHDFINLIL